MQTLKKKKKLNSTDDSDRYLYFGAAGSQAIDNRPSRSQPGNGVVTQLDPIADKVGQSKQGLTMQHIWRRSVCRISSDKPRVNINGSRLIQGSARLLTVCLISTPTSHRRVRGRF